MASSNGISNCKEVASEAGHEMSSFSCLEGVPSKENADMNMLEGMNWETVSQSLIFSGLKDQVELDTHKICTGDPESVSPVVFSTRMPDMLKEDTYIHTGQVVFSTRVTDITEDASSSMPAINENVFSFEKQHENEDDISMKTHSLVNLDYSQRYNSCPASEAGNIDLLNEAHREDSSGSDSPEIHTNLLNFNRMKSRFQDPPPLTSAIKSQLTYCNSTVVRRRGPANAASASMEPETGSTDLPSLNVVVASKDDIEQKMETSNNSNVGDNLSSSKGNPNAEEEPDPFSDDFVPEGKNENESKWLISIQWIGLFILTALLVCSVEIRVLEKVLFLGLNLWRWQALALVILCGHLISGWIMKLLVVLIEKHYLLKKKVLYFVYGLRNCVKNSIWLALVVGVWGVIFEGHEDTTAVNIVSKILWCLFTASVSWMVKVLVVKVAASNFHRTAYFEKIQECLFNQYLLEKFSGPPTMAQFFISEENKNSYSGSKHRKHRRGSSSTHSLKSENSVPENDHLRMQSEKQIPPVKEQDVASTTFTQFPFASKSANTIHHEKLQDLTSETVPVWTLKKLMKIVRNTNLKTYSSMLCHEKQDINSEAQAKLVAKQIFQNMTRPIPGQKCITMTNFLYFLHKDQALKAFSMFDKTETGEISKQAFAKWVVNAYKDRRALCLTLSDNKTIIEKLHMVLNWVLGVILIAAFVLIFGVETSKVLLFVSSIILPSVFMFGNAAKVLFESLIFLFVTHPFDVGDRIVIDGQPMLVEEMNIMHTILLSPSNEKIYYPNFLLAGKPISNFYRSPDQWDSIDFQIHMKTPLEKLTLLKERIQKYVEGLPQFWYPEFRISCKDIEDSNKMKMGMWLRHRLNFQEGGERLQRRSSVLLFLKQQLEELDISYQLPLQEIIVTGFSSTYNF